MTKKIPNVRNEVIMKFLTESEINDLKSKLADIDTLKDSNDLDLINDQHSIRMKISEHYSILSYKQFQNLNLTNLDNPINTGINVIMEDLTDIMRKLLDECQILSSVRYRLTENIEEALNIETVINRKENNRILGRADSFLEENEIENIESKIVEFSEVMKSRDRKFLQEQHDYRSDLFSHYLNPEIENKKYEQYGQELIQISRKIVKILDTEIKETQDN